MNSKPIIYFLIMFLLISFSYLSYTGGKRIDYDYQNDWWVLYFDDPKSENLNFTIENHSANNNFHWEASADSGKIKEGDVEIKKGGTEKIGLPKPDFDKGKKITVEVFRGDEEREIYKFIDK